MGYAKLCSNVKKGETAVSVNHLCSVAHAVCQVMGHCWN